MNVRRSWFVRGAIVTVFALTLSSCQTVQPTELVNEASDSTNLVTAASLPPLTPEQEAFLDDLVTLTIEQVVGIAAAAYGLAQADPMLTEAELDEYVVDAVALAAQPTPSTLGFYEEAEKLMGAASIVTLYLFAENPFRSAVIVKTYADATQLRPEYFPGEGLRQDPPQREDAFRHVLGMILAVNELQQLVLFTFADAGQFAAAAGDANECIGLGAAVTETCRELRYGSTYITDPHIRNQILLRTEMDLINNAWAIDWAVQTLPTFSSPERTTTYLADLVEDLVRGPGTPYSGIVSIVPYETGLHPGFAIDCRPISPTEDWCIVPVEEDLLNQRGVVYVLVEDLYEVLYVETILSFADLDLSDAEGTVDHTPIPSVDRSYHLYELPPGTHVVEIVGLDGYGYFVFAFKQTFTLAAGESARFDPSVDYSLVDPVFYNGPLDDCPRLQGVYTVEVDRLFGASVPTINVNPSTSSMYLNGMGLPLIEYQKLNNYPLVVEAATIRSCNVTEGEHFLGWDIDAGYSNPASPVGFYVFIDARIENQDNNWPGAVWNRTDLTPNPTNCPIVPIDTSFTSIDGKPRAQQSIPGLLAGDHDVFYSSFETLYQWTSTAYDANNMPFVVSSSYWTPPYLDEKFTYNGVSQWVHLVTEWPAHTCGPAPLGKTSRSHLNEPDNTKYWTESTRPEADFSRPRLEDVRR